MNRKEVNKIDRYPLKIIEKDYFNRWCQRCDKYFCSECVTFTRVRFHVIENIKGRSFDWIQNNLCPKCYNELVEKYYKQLHKKISRS